MRCIQCSKVVLSVQDLDFDRSMDSWPKARFAMACITHPCLFVFFALTVRKRPTSCALKASTSKEHTLQSFECSLQVLWGAGVEQLAHDRMLAQQVVALTPSDNTITFSAYSTWQTPPVQPNCSNSTCVCFFSGSTVV